MRMFVLALKPERSYRVGTKLSFPANRWITALSLRCPVLPFVAAPTETRCPECTWWDNCSSRRQRRLDRSLLLPSCPIPRLWTSAGDTKTQISIAASQMPCWGEQEKIKVIENVWKIKASGHTWDKTSEPAGFQRPHYRLYALWAETSQGAECPAGAQRKPRGRGSDLRSAQHHLQHGRLPPLPQLRLRRYAYLQVLEGRSLMESGCPFALLDHRVKAGITHTV